MLLFLSNIHLLTIGEVFMNLFQNKKKGTLLTGASLNSFSSQVEAKKKNALKVSFQNSDSRSKDISKEALWYPVSYDQKQKELEEAQWIKNHPNASAGELMYPSMRPSKAQEVAKQLADREKKVAMDKRNEAQSKMSKEELYYPTMYAQQQKAKQEALWVKNNPNASAAELMYPSMRKAKPVVQKQALDLDKLSPEQRQKLDPNLKSVISHHNDSKNQENVNLKNQNQALDLDKLSPEQRQKLDPNLKSAISHHNDSKNQANVDLKTQKQALDLDKLSPEQRQKLDPSLKLTISHHNDSNQLNHDENRKLREEEKKRQQYTENTARKNRVDAMHKKSTEEASVAQADAKLFSDIEKLKNGDPTVNRKEVEQRLNEFRGRKHPDPDQEAVDAKSRAIREAFNEWHLGTLNLVEIDSEEYKQQNRKMNILISGAEAGYTGKLFNSKSAVKPDNMTAEEKGLYMIGQLLSDSPKTILAALAALRGGGNAGLGVIAGFEAHHALLTDKDLGKALIAGTNAAATTALTGGLGKGLNAPMQEVNSAYTPALIEIMQLALENPDNVTGERIRKIWAKHTTNAILRKRVEKGL